MLTILICIEIKKNLKIICYKILILRFLVSTWYLNYLLPSTNKEHSESVALDSVKLEVDISETKKHIIYELNIVFFVRIP